MQISIHSLTGHAYNAMVSIQIMITDQRLPCIMYTNIAAEAKRKNTDY